MTKNQLKRKLKALGEAHTDIAIARIFGCKYQAVQQWDKLPKGRIFELMVKRPDLYKSSRP